MIPDCLNIIRAENHGDYRLAIDFDDGTHQIVDFKPFLVGTQHPDIRVFLDVAKFSDFRVEYGDLVWGDYTLCFPIADLYQNRIAAISCGKVAA